MVGGRRKDGVNEGWEGTGWWNRGRRRDTDRITRTPVSGVGIEKVQEIVDDK